MKKFIIAANWKMNLNLEQAKTLANQVKDLNSKNDIIICPQALHLQTIIEVVKNTQIKVGGQNSSMHESGAYTGEISPASLADIGAKYVIIGHSERRKYFGETPELISQKAEKAIESGLIPIVCIGESAEDRKSGNTIRVVENDFKNSVPQGYLNKVIIAYEPLWAIGTGLTPTSSEISEVHDLIKSLSADKTPVLYGGSANSKNCAEILAIPSVDGLLVGGASLKIDELKVIANS